MHRIIQFATACLLLIGCATFAQPGQIDPYFSNPALVLGDSSRFGGVNNIAENADGKILITCTTYNGVHNAGVLRFTADGQLDTTFNTLWINGTSGRALSIQPDGKVIFSTQAYSNYGNIIRLNTDGSLDTSFYTGGVGFSTDFPTATTLQPDGKILVTGGFTSYDGVAVPHMMRLNTDGHIDTTFQLGTGFDGRTEAVLYTQAGKILVGGNFLNYQGVQNYFIAQLNTDGSIDTSFHFYTSLSDVVICLVQQPDGDILVAGEFTFAADNILRIHPNGSRDQSFHLGNNNGIIAHVALQSDGKILVTGPNLTILDSDTVSGYGRLNADGTIDSTFYIGGGVGPSHNASAILVQSNSNILLGVGTQIHTAYRNRIANLSPEGRLINNWRISYGCSYAQHIAEMAGNTILVGGNFSRFDDFMCNKVTRILPVYGNVDTAFRGSSYNFQFGYYSLNYSPVDQHIYLGGELYYLYNGQHYYGLARMDINGNMDTAFFEPQGFQGSAEIYKVVVQPDGKILAGGILSSFGPATVYGIIRLHPDGSRDTTFSGTASGLYSSAQVNDIVLQPDGKIIIGGVFSIYSSPSLTYKNLVRLNQDGSLDTTYQIGSGLNGTVNDLLFQPDGKLLVGGAFSKYQNTINCYNVVRLNADGSYDSTFASSTHVYGEVKSMALQPDGRIIIAGNCLRYDNIDRLRIMRLNDDASLDATFDPGTGFDAVVNQIALSASGELYVCGNFTEYNGYTVHGVCKLDPGNIVSIHETADRQTFTVYPNPSSGRFRVQCPVGLSFPAPLTVYDNMGRMIKKVNLTEQEPEITLNLPEGLYTLRLCSSKSVFTGRLLITQ